MRTGTLKPKVLMLLATCRSCLSLWTRGFSGSGWSSLRGRLTTQRAALFTAGIMNILISFLKEFAKVGTANGGRKPSIEGTRGKCQKHNSKIINSCNRASQKPCSTAMDFTLDEEFCNKNVEKSSSTIPCSFSHIAMCFSLMCRVRLDDL